MDSTELTHLLISWFTLSLAFSMNAAWIGLPQFMISFPIVLLTLGTGFIFHELAHRYVARKLGCWAAFRAWFWGLAVALGLAILTGGRFVFAAPGAVYIGGRVLSTRENGYVSIAGPLMNIIVGIGFLVLMLSYPNSIIGYIGTMGAYINLFLAAFNLIPIPPLDGYKVMQWSVPVWLVAMAIPAMILLEIL
ncbi:MAG: site-2 protease family protein [Candidatus Diapherotrites archaeon]|nr:site-2 protease family protein [Candidatus Diapherotrites archaeon]